VAVLRLGAERPLDGHALDAAEAALQELVGLGFDPAGDADVRRSSVRRVVLEPTVLRRVV
jgi:hypothetical protein